MGAIKNMLLEQMGKEEAAAAMDLAARQDRRLTIPNVWAELAEDATLEGEYAAYRRTGRRHAIHRAAKAAELIRRLWPIAHTVVVDLRYTVDSGVQAELITVRDADGVLLWHDSGDFAYHPDAVALAEIEAYGGPARVEIEGDTRKAIEALIEAAEESNSEQLPAVDEKPYLDGAGNEVYYDGHLAALDIPNALVDAEQLTVDSIGFDKLAEILRRETSVIDGEDVDGLMAVIRTKAGGSVHYQPADGARCSRCGAVVNEVTRGCTGCDPDWRSFLADEERAGLEEDLRLIRKHNAND